ncbi:class I SAM-dependent methyltransferase, partial [Streptomyces sp. WAC05950]|uniref:class I SAM-dependent methyltransferase n=1 Tax=Streptomyces sp. WAC05950 TaxID=2487419 RepID=UPI00292A3D36
SQGRRSQPAGRIVEIPRPTLSDNGSTAAAPAVRRSDVDAGRWPDVARLPSAGPGRTAAARYLTDRALNRLGLTPLSAGAHSSAAGPRLILHDPAAFHRRIGRHGLTGFGESYMAGEWDSDDLPGALTVLAEHVDELVPATLRRLRGLWVSARPAADRNTQAGARANVRHHYDLSNEFYALLLDESMAYSCAYWTRPEDPAYTLADAQRDKLELIFRKL